MDYRWDSGTRDSGKAAGPRHAHKKRVWRYHPQNVRCFLKSSSFSRLKNRCSYLGKGSGAQRCHEGRNRPSSLSEPQVWVAGSSPSLPARWDRGHRAALHCAPGQRCPWAGPYPARASLGSPSRSSSPKGRLRPGRPRGKLCGAWSASGYAQELHSRAVAWARPAGTGPRPGRRAYPAPSRVWRSPSPGPSVS